MYKNLYNLVLVMVGAIAIGLGVYGFHLREDFAKAGTAQSAQAGDHHKGSAKAEADESAEAEGDNEEGSSSPVKKWFSRVIKTLDLVRGRGEYNGPWPLVLAQLALPCVAVLAAAQFFFLGLRRDMRVFLVRRKRGHTIVCGLGNIGTQIVQNLRKSGQDVVAIDLNVDSPNAATLERAGVPILKGNARTPDVLSVAGLRKAQIVVVCTGSDAVNVDIALGIQKFVASDPRNFRALTVLVELRDEWLFDRLINHDKAPLSSDKVQLRFFNSYAIAARMLVGALHLPPCPEFSADTFVLIGFGSSGQESALALVRAAPVPLGRTLKVVVFDQKAGELQPIFQNSSAAAMELAEFEFVTANLKKDSIDLTTIVKPKLRGRALLGVAVCLPSDEEGLYAALEMRSLLDRMEQLRVPIYLCLEHCRRLGNLAGDIERLGQMRDRLCVFGTFEELLSPKVLLDENLDVLARAFHEDYRRRPKDQLNPQSDVPWHELPEFLKMSNRWRADHLPVMLAFCGFEVKRNVSSPAILELTGEEVELLAQYEHRRYAIERRLLEWTPGEKWHHGRRVAPHLVAWAELSDSQKDWNREEVKKTPKALAALGIEMRRQRKIRAYGSFLAAADLQLKQAIADPGPYHYVLIADIDDPQAKDIIKESGPLPLKSLWLISGEEPREFHEGKGAAADVNFSEAVKHAEGWLPRQMVRLE